MDDCVLIHITVTNNIKSVGFVLGPSMGNVKEKDRYENT